jgi:hypothetical protein
MEEKHVGRMNEIIRRKEFDYRQYISKPGSGLKWQHKTTKARGPCLVSEERALQK